LSWPGGDRNGALQREQRLVVDGVDNCTYQLWLESQAYGATMSRPPGFVDDAEGDEKGSRRANPIDVHVGGRVRFRRMLLGMSQEKLGERLGLTFQQVQKYEKGINRIGASRLFDLAQVLGVPVQFFYEEAPSSDPPPVVPDGFSETPAENVIVQFLRSRDGLELNKAFVRISDAKARRAIVDLVRSLANDDNAMG
jgi:transcriptional regulator with XRE-family HTH domain